MRILSIILISWIILSTFSGSFSMVEGVDAGKFYGEVESMPERGFAGIWIINGRKVQATNKTIIDEKHGKASAGAFAEVEGKQSGDIFNAYEIEIKQGKDFRKSAYPGKFYGAVQRLPDKGWQGVWIINDREILVTGHTKIEEKYGKVTTDALVKVEGNYSGKNFIAYEIEVKGVKKYRHDKPRQDRSYNSRFAGVVESMPQDKYEGLWVVDGRNVEVNNKTSIDETGGKASVGAYVKIKGIRKGKTIIAYVIEIISKQK